MARPFSFADVQQSGSFCGVLRPILRYSLMACLLAATAFAAWSWFRPYEWGPDPKARGEVLETLVTRDQSFFWVNVHLKVTPGLTHDLQKNVHLKTSQGGQLEPADTTLVGKDGQPISEIWLKFWLESSQMEEPLTLYLNDGKLSIKSSREIPDLGDSNYRNFVTNHW